VALDSWSTKKKLVIVLLVLLAAIPFSLLTESVPARIQGWVVENKESTWAPWVQMKLAGLYAWTIRTSKMFDCYVKYIELFGPDNPNYDKESYMQIEFDTAVMAGRLRSKTRGLEELSKFIDKYPGTELGRQAEKEKRELLL